MDRKRKTRIFSENLRVWSPRPLQTRIKTTKATTENTLEHI
jgi:hypothetical protein